MCKHFHAHDSTSTNALKKTLLLQLTSCIVFHQNSTICKNYIPFNIHLGYALYEDNTSQQHVIIVFIGVILIEIHIKITSCSAEQGHDHKELVTVIHSLIHVDSFIVNTSYTITTTKQSSSHIFWTIQPLVTSLGHYY